MNYGNVLSEIYAQTKNRENSGHLASYIPELARVNPSQFGIHIRTLTNENYAAGDSDTKFSIQSVSKVLSLSLALSIVGEDTWDRLGVEPSGTPFNSLLQLENDNGIPRNPFINAGALVISDILLSHLKNPKADFLNFIHGLSGNTSITFNEKVAASEKSVGYRNVALCNYIKSFGNIKNNPDDVLDFYFNLCSLEMTCKELAETFLFLANDGKTENGEQVLTTGQAKRVCALMLTCGFYDESGEFAFKVGLPGKSGVGGGIIAILPDEYAIAVWSPLLNDKGNSFKGMCFLEDFTTATGFSIF